MVLSSYDIIKTKAADVSLDDLMEIRGKLKGISEQIVNGHIQYRLKTVKGTIGTWISKLDARSILEKSYKQLQEGLGITKAEEDQVMEDAFGHKGTFGQTYLNTLL